MNDESKALMVQFNEMYDLESKLLTELAGSIRDGRGYTPDLVQLLIETSDKLETLREQISAMNQYQEEEPSE